MKDYNISSIYKHKLRQDRKNSYSALKLNDLQRKNKIQVWVVTNDKELMFIEKNSTSGNFHSFTPSDVTVESYNLSDAINKIENIFGIMMYNDDLLDYLYTLEDVDTKERTDVYCIFLNVKKETKEFFQSQYNVNFMNVDELAQRVSNHDRFFYSEENSLDLLIAALKSKFE